MREHKQRSTRRTVEFFTACCGFRHPFKVILDGNFIHAAFTTRLDDLVRQLQTVLHVKAAEPLRLHIPACALHELRTLSSEFAEAAQWAQEHAKPLACGHGRRPVSPDECIRSLVGEGNAEHFFVATQDTALRQALGGMQAGACLFITPNGVQLAQPTEQQLRLSKQSVEEGMVPSSSERQSGALAELEQLRQPLHTSSRFRRRKAKGPNPLSARPKRDPGQPKKKRPGPALRRALAAEAAAAAGGGGGGAAGQKSEAAREKQRRRKKKQKSGRQEQQAEAQ